MQVIVFGSRDAGTVTQWVRQAGGRLSVNEFERLYRRYFNCSPNLLERACVTGDVRFQLKDGTISEIERERNGRRKAKLAN